MAKYILRRLLIALLTLWAIVTIVFFLVRSMPGNPFVIQFADRGTYTEAMVDNFNKKYGLDKNIFIQYFTYIKNLVSFDLGDSINQTGRSVISVLSNQGGRSLEVNLIALLVGLGFGIALGVLAAYTRGKWPDMLSMFLAVAGICIPSFVLASLLQYFFAIQLNILPAAGWETDLLNPDHYKYLIVPVICLSFGGTAVYARYTRASILETLNQDFVLAARTRGAHGLYLALHHVVRNSILPLVTLIGPSLAGLIVGSVVIEKIFSIPGLGFVYVEAINSRDYPLILGFTVVLSAFYILALLWVDIMYAILDPRITLHNEEGTA